jgi:hypothetical protein
MDEAIRRYKDRIRIFLILYIFGEPYHEPAKPQLKKIFRTETRIQKIDFLLRNPDYLAFELLLHARSNPDDREDIKLLVREIVTNREPSLKRLDMERFFFGAYEDIDDVISFLKSIGFIEFTSAKSSDMKTIDKKYFVTDDAIKKAGAELSGHSPLDWYVERCKLIKQYFGEMSATELKSMQYEIDEYKDTAWKDQIGEIEAKVRSEFFDVYGETI